MAKGTKVYVPEKTVDPLWIKAAQASHAAIIAKYGKGLK